MKIDLLAAPYKKERKGDVKKLRNQGKIPAVLYGHKEKTMSIYIDKKDFKGALEILRREASIINLKINNKLYHCFLKSVQHNPISGELLHIDFQHIHKKEKIKAEVPIHLIGNAPGVEKGGILDQHLHEVMVKCLADDIPPHIDIDISKLDLGETIHLRDLNLPNVELTVSLNTSIVSVFAPKAEVVKPVITEEAVVEEKKEELKEEGEKPTKEEKKKEK